MVKLVALVLVLLGEGLVGVDFRLRNRTIPLDVSGCIAHARNSVSCQLRIEDIVLAYQLLGAAQVHPAVSLCV